MSGNPPSLRVPPGVEAGYKLRMSSPGSIQGSHALPSHRSGPSAELRRFSAGMRIVNALLCMVLLISAQSAFDAWALPLLVSYSAWAAYVLWLESRGRARHSALLCYWIDVAWSCLVLQLFDSGTMMMIVTLVQPVVLASIGYGVRHGVRLALFAALGLLLDRHNEFMSGLYLSWAQAAPALAVLALVLSAALLARPVNLLRRRLALVDELEAQLDPRRGLEPICTALVERLREGTHAEVAVLVLPSGLDAPAVLASRDDGGFRASPKVHQRLEALLQCAPACPLTHVQRRWWDPRPATRPHDDLPVPDGLAQHLEELARLLDVRSLHVVPLTRYGRGHGHFVVGYGAARGASREVAALAAAAPELLRIVEQAALVDQLQEESAGHERARIGRDLHDSAIQPYLGLKYAVECAALRIPPDNPARAEIASLAELVNAEIGTLRELISGLRTGNASGDNALVPAVRRQVRRFALLFGIEIEIDCPETLPTSRALASALFHMVNEALNNVRKHTPARKVWITLAAEPAAIRLVVRDDGGSVRGRPAADFRPGSLSERARELGGSLDITRADGLNTEIVIQIPT
jgi:signal transduction histidine kinase